MGHPLPGPLVQRSNRSKDYPLFSVSLCLCGEEELSRHRADPLHPPIELP